MKRDWDERYATGEAPPRARETPRAGNWGQVQVKNRSRPNHGLVRDLYLSPILLPVPNSHSILQYGNALDEELLSLGDVGSREP